MHEIKFERTFSVDNQDTTYSFSLYLRKYKERKFQYLLSSNSISNRKDELSKWISEQDIYIAFHNHWNNINPLKLFANSFENGNPKSYSIIPILPDKPTEIKTLYSTY